MLPGKTYTPEEVLSILRRRIWLFLIPFALVSASTAIVTGRLPNRYRSEAMIMVVPQGVTDIYVMPAVTRRIEERLPAITQQILSRTRLEPIIEQFNSVPGSPCRRHQRSDHQAIARLDLHRPGPCQRVLCQLCRVRSPHRPESHRAVDLVGDYGERDVPLDAGGGDEPVPRGSTRRGATTADRTRTTARNVSADVCHRAAVAGDLQSAGHAEHADANSTSGRVHESR